MDYSAVSFRQYDYPYTMRQCVKHGMTDHEVRAGSSLIAYICIKCRQEAWNYELDRE